jgi:hypothetical protein
MNILGSNQVVCTFDKSLALGEKSGPAVNNHGVHVFLTMLFNLGRAYPLRHRGHI